MLPLYIEMKKPAPARTNHTLKNSHNPKWLPGAVYKIWGSAPASARDMYYGGRQSIVQLPVGSTPCPTYAATGPAYVHLPRSIKTPNPTLPPCWVWGST
ncbi:hypothetical protein GCM10027348_08500 [Hymenobacter tenuis]